MTVPPIWSEDRWLVEPGTGRRYIVVELEPREHAPVSPRPTGRPPLLAWALLCGSGALVAVAALGALVVVGFDSPAAAALNWLVIVGGLATMVLCAVAAARMHDNYRAPVVLGHSPRTALMWPPAAPVRHLQPVELPGCQRVAVSRSRPALGRGGKGAPMD